MGTLDEWRKLIPKGEGHLMTFIVHRTSSGRIGVGITRNVIFLTPPRELRIQTKEGISKNCKYLGRFVLTEVDTKQLQAMYPGLQAMVSRFTNNYKQCIQKNLYAYFRFAI